MRATTPFFLLTLLLTSGCATASSSATVERNFARAFATANVRALARLFTADADLRTLAGGQLTGRDELRRFFAAGLRGSYRGARMLLRRERARTLSSDLRLADGCWCVTGDGLPAGYPTHGDYTLLLVRRAERWQIAAARFSVPRQGHTRGRGRDPRCIPGDAP